MNRTRRPRCIYWAVWADALLVFRARCPDAAARCLAELTQGPVSVAACLRAGAGRPCATP